MSRQERTARATKAATATVEGMVTKARTRRAPRPALVEFTVAWRAVYRDANVGVHAPGCKDLASEKRRHSANLSTLGYRVATVSALEAAVLAQLNTDFKEDPYGPEAVRVYNCAKALIGNANFEAMSAAQKASEATSKPKAPATTPAPRQGGSNDQAAECRRLRDEQGMAWWLIGKTLGLPGAGDSATTGKSGAHQARRLYASANGGQVPRTRAPRGKAAEVKGPGQVGTKTDRKIALTLGEQVIPEELDEEGVVKLLAGKHIEWAVNLADLCPGADEWYNHEARVHPTDVVVDEELSKDGCRTVRFREFYGWDKDTHQPLAGPTRTVRLRSIHTVKG